MYRCCPHLVGVRCLCQVLLQKVIQSRPPDDFVINIRDIHDEGDGVAKIVLQYPPQNIHGDIVPSCTYIRDDTGLPWLPAYIGLPWSMSRPSPHLVLLTSTGHHHIIPRTLLGWSHQNKDLRPLTMAKVGCVIYCWTTCVPCYMVSCWVQRHELLLLLCQSIVKLQHALLCSRTTIPRRSPLPFSSLRCKAYLRHIWGFLLLLCP